MLLLLRDLDDGETARADAGRGRASGSTRSSRRTTPTSSTAGSRSARAVLGVNARDLATFAIDRTAQLELVARIPADRIVIAESGIETRAQGAAAELAGADAVLVGSTLMRAADPAAKLAELLSRPLVKVCGLTREEDVAAAAEAGADLAGFILVPESPRAATAVLPVPDGMLSVAVWVGEAGEAGADLDQVHTVEEGKVRGREAALLRDGDEVARAARPPLGGHRSRPLARRAAEAEGRIVLAGRLGPDNVREAIAAVRPWAVDAASSLESAPGNQGSRQGEAIRGGGPLMTTTEETYGPYGGRYVPETLIPALDELTAAWAEALADPAYLAEVEHLGRTYTGRPSPITLAPRFAPASGSTSSARTSTTPARTRSTTRSARSCSRAGSARRGSSPRRAPGSTASRPRPPARASGSSASSSWAPRTCGGRRRTSSGCT